MERSQAAALLGIEIDASSIEAKKAYQARARLLHPDRFAGASKADIEAATAAMAQLNQAYEIFQQPAYGSQSKNEYARQAQREYRSDFPSWAAADSTCDICGWGPAAPATFRSITGLIVGFSGRKFEGLVCRVCGENFYNEAQAHTLTKGWWGLIAFVVTIYSFFANVASMSGVKRLGVPEGKNWQKVTFLEMPMLVTRSWWRRPGPWLASAGFLLMFLIFLSFGSDQEADRGGDQSVAQGSTNALPSGGVGKAWEFDVGSCLIATKDDGLYVTEFRSVSCDSQHEFKYLLIEEVETSFEAFDIEAINNVAARQCRVSLQTFVLNESESEYLFSQALIPTQNAWNAGNRLYVCLIGKIPFSVS